MAETWTTRMDLPQWGSGVDSVARVDFDAAFLNIDTRAAYDDGLTYSAVPTANLVSGRYARVSTTDGSYTLYRRSPTAWEYVGGPVAPIKQRVVALSGQVATDQALSIESALGTVSAYLTYGGDFYSIGVTRSASLLASAPLGDTLSPSTTGRAYVKTQATGDLGLVLRAHASTAGNLLTAREQGGSDVTTIDSSGRLRSTVASAFGGASMPTASTLAVAPSANTSDPYVNGLLLYGQQAAPSRNLLVAYPYSGDPVGPISTWSPNGITMGRLPWGTPGNSDGALNLAADVMYLRASGANLPGAAQYSSWFNFRRASVASPTDQSQDTNVLSMGLAGAALGLPLSVSQENNGSVTNLTAYRFNDFTAGRFLELIQCTRVNPTTITFQTAADWNADGRMRSGMLWRGASTVRDARLSIIHVSSKVYAVTGQSGTSGQAVAPTASFTYTFPVMQSRSFGGCDLAVDTLMEMMLGVGSGGNVDGQAYRLECWMAINGGAFNEINYQESAQSSSASGIRPVGDLFGARFRLASVPNGATFQVQLRVFNGNAVPILYIRKLDIEVSECSFEVYTAT